MEIKKLDRELYEVCTRVPVDLERAEELLKRGANPMGAVEDSYEVVTNLYAGVVSAVFDNCETPEDFYTVTELFMRYGLDVSKPSVPYDEYNSVHNPLWYFAFPANDCVKRTLKLLLDNGLSADDAAECWSHEEFDLVNLGLDFETKDEMEEFYDYVRKLMLIASYPHVLDEDEDLRRVIWYGAAGNDYDLVKFRNWNDYSFEVDTSLCPRYSGPYHSVVTIVEKNTGDKVWKLGVRLDAECPAKTVLDDEVLYVAVDKEGAAQFNAQSCDCDRVVIAMRSCTVLAEFKPIPGQDEGEIAVRCVKSYDEERFCHIVRPKKGETIRFVKLNHYPNGHVQEIKYKFGDGYLFLFADECDLILTKSVCDLFEEDDTPIPVRDPSVLFE